VHAEIPAADLSKKFRNGYATHRTGTIDRKPGSHHISTERSRSEGAGRIGALTFAPIPHASGWTHGLR
jgi:hypothetical protein